MNAKGQIQYSVDTKALIDALRPYSVGDLVTYEKLDGDLKMNTRGQARGSLRTARRALLTEGIRFDTVRNVGLKRMSDAEIATSGARSIRLIRGTARRETAKLTAISDFGSLTNEEKIQHNATLSVLGAVAHFSKPAQVKILEGAVAATRAWLPTAETIEVMRLSLLPGKKGKP